jgi:hypothetical protein
MSTIPKQQFSSPVIDLKPALKQFWSYVEDGTINARNAYSQAKREYDRAFNKSAQWQSELVRSEAYLHRAETELRKLGIDPKDICTT